MNPAFSFSDMASELKQSQLHQSERQQDACKESKPLHITILRNIMLEPIETPIRFYARQSGYEAQIIFGDFDNIFQDGLNPEKITPNTDAILVVTPLIALAPKIIHAFCSLNEQEKNQELLYIETFVHQTLSNIKQLNQKAHVLWLSFESPVFPSMGINDRNMSVGQTQFIEKINLSVKNLLQEFKNCHHLNTDLILIKLGADHFYDWRYWHIAKALYSRSSLMHIAQMQQSYLNCILGHNKKCLVLDCDNTLWGGIIGEDGFANLQISNDYPGSCYRDFQAAVLDLYHQGVIIALCSKNNETDVLEVFKMRSEMLLKLEHIATSQINWDDKASNLIKIANALNISLESLVFLDDSAFEIDLVKKQLPQVLSIWLDNTQPIQYVKTLRSLTCFNTLSITQEDLNRGRQYQEQIQRKNVLPQGNLDDYLRSLSIKLNVFIISETNVPRAAQQTQKTNQFNLTTKRYSNDDIYHFMQSNDYDVFGLSVSDRFGDMGMVGVAILQYKHDHAILDTFLLSCRALGRKIEHAFLHEILNFCKRKKIRYVMGLFYKTAKNKPAENFLAECAFEVKSFSPDECVSELLLSTYQYEKNTVFEIDTSPLM